MMRELPLDSKSRCLKYLPMWLNTHDMQQWLLNVRRHHCSAEATVAALLAGGLASAHIAAVQKPPYQFQRRAQLAAYNSASKMRNHANDINTKA